MRRVTAVVGVVLATACSQSTPQAPVIRVATSAPAPRASLAPGCHGIDCTPSNGCIAPLCHLVYATPEPTRASRSRRVTSTKIVRPHLRPHVVDGRLMRVTCYDSGTITASGKRVREGMVAVIDYSIPFGTKVTVDSFGTFVVEDHIGHGSQIDIYRSHCPIDFPTGMYRATFHN